MPRATSMTVCMLLLDWYGLPASDRTFRPRSL